LKMQEATASTFKAHPAPKAPKKPATVRLTTTAIMREDALYKKKQEQEKAIIDAYESNLRDAHEFSEWQLEMRAKDEALRNHQVAQRRKEMAESAIHAMEAKEADFEHKKAVAEEMKIESELMAQKAKEEREQQRVYNRQIAADVRQIERLAKEAVAKAHEDRVLNAREIVEEREEIEKKVAEQMELERQRRADQVQLQRAQAEISKQKIQNSLQDNFDSTTTQSAQSGQGAFLDEMSYMEMKERSLMNQGKQKAKTEERRVKNIEKKLEKERELRDKAEQLQRIRQQSRKEASDRKAKEAAAKAEAARVQKEANDTMWLALHEKIQTKKKKKKEEEERILEEAKAQEIKRQFMNADASKVEEIKWKELEKGAEREAKQRQREYQTEALRSEALKEKEAVQKARNVRDRQREKTKKIRQYDRDQEEAHAITEQQRDAIEQSKIAKAKVQHQLEANQRKQVKDSYPQVANFSSEAYRANKEREVKKKTSATLRLKATEARGVAATLPPADYTKKRSTSISKTRPISNGSRPASRGSVNSQGSNGSRESRKSVRELEKYQTMELGYDSSELGCQLPPCAPLLACSFLPWCRSPLVLLHRRAPPPPRLPASLV